MTRLALLAAAFLAAAPAAAFSVPGFELVQSYPAETTLQQGGLRLAQDVWPEMLDSAKKTIDIEQFYIAPSSGQPLDKSLDALRRAGERGVKIRFLLEKKFERNSLDGIAILKTIPNLELRIIEWSKVAGTGIVHAKLMVVDSTQAYIGSQNWDWRSLKHIHEMGLRVTEPSVVRDIQAVVDHDWKAAELTDRGEGVPTANSKRPEVDRARRAYLVASPWMWVPAGIGDSESELPRLVAEASKSVDVQVMDYSPTTYERPKRFYGVFDNALRDASVRGVAVRLMVADWSTDEPAIHHLKSLSLLPGVAVKVCTIPQSKDGYIPFSRVIHSKYMTVDRKALWLGTSNWSGGYLDNSRNAEVVVRDPALAVEAGGAFDRVWTSAYCEPIDVRKAYPKPKK
jgi:phosphatidylserine/phosphatidylglycerophosphate/cardiolipin synthase-like enzyme